MRHKIEVNAECAYCGGTGLYVGMAENNGAAVVCNNCKGKGETQLVFEYNDFTGRKTKKGVKVVYECNVGIMIGENDKIKLEDFGGMSYADWLNGKKFELGMEDRKHTCPAWYYQCANYDKKPNWKECTGWGGCFSNCKYFKEKHKCWERFDKENKE